MIYKLLFFLALLFPLTASAQFITQGTITYERTFKIKRALQWEDNYKWVKKFATDIPKDVSAPFVLRFNKEKSTYKFQETTSGKDAQTNWIVNNFAHKDVAYKNEVATNYQTGMMESIKKVFEKNFMITDSLPRFKWKIEDEIRVIAGYPCRKAVTTICDSVVVVAFYTDQIMVSGGPESFNGLPGMILGIAIPRLYTTWFATDVSQNTPRFTPPDIPRKTHTVSRREFYEELRKDTKSWGNYADKMLWRVTL
ncbi:MAG TPA: GLPGLI family protein [Edaphocola sp.]|nr:GLPGLI family protein [Edaphocola sp.]